MKIIFLLDEANKVSTWHWVELNKNEKTKSYLERMPMWMGKELIGDRWGWTDRVDKAKHVYMYILANAVQKEWEWMSL